MPYGNINVDTVTTSTAGGVLGAGNASIMKNRIINGAMVISQRGTSFTPANNDYTLDRWQGQLTQSSKYTVAQSSTAPTGFINSLLVTSSSAYSVAAGDYFGVLQPIEGLNCTDLAWGTANAKTVTLSFQVYSSLTGTFGGTIFNNAASVSYPFSYTVSSANTWTSISVTIAGPTTGTWLTTNSRGIIVWFGLGAGSTYSGTANTWANTWYAQPTSTVSVVGTNGATFYITGVQLEVGSSATGFEYRQYTTELQLCQRFFASTFSQGTAVTAANASNSNGIMGKGGSTSLEPYANWSLPVEMRTTPTCTTYNPYTSGTAGQWGNSGGNFGSASGARVVGTSTRNVTVDNTGNTLTASNQYSICISGTAEL